MNLRSYIAALRLEQDEHDRAELGYRVALALLVEQHDPAEVIAKRLDSAARQSDRELGRLLRPHLARMGIQT